MNPVDIILAILVAVSGLMSFRVGLIREAFALGALLIGLLAAVVLGRAYGPRVPDVIGNEVATQVVFFFACFVVVHVLIVLLGVVISRLIKAMQLSWVDHLLGFVFGAVRGAILGLLILAVLTLVLPRQHKLLAESQGYRLARGPLRLIAQMLPEKAEEALRERHRLYERIVPSTSDEESETLPLGKGGIPLRL